MMPRATARSNAPTPPEHDTTTPTGQHATPLATRTRQALSVQYHGDRYHLTKYTSLENALTLAATFHFVAI